jgi:hypothetical protein
MKVSAIIFLGLGGLFASAVQAGQAGRLLQSGSYEVTYRLEVPHVEEWAVDSTVRICIRNAKRTALPVLSVNNPLSKCPASNIRQSGETLSFDIKCKEREGARAKAVYRLKPNQFQGRIAMTMGGKNMTFVEVQSGHRIGSCMLAGDPIN